VRYDPFNMGQVYAYVHGHWRKCISEYYLVFSKCSEQEFKLASTEIRRRRQQHGKRFNLNASKLANFLMNFGEKENELLQQRKRDGEMRKAQAGTEDTSSVQAPASSKMSDLTSPATETVNGESREVSYRLAGGADITEPFDPETYEEYE
jgi:putative transposase